VAVEDVGNELVRSIAMLKVHMLVWSMC
jgi:hypothetical protein